MENCRNIFNISARHGWSVSMENMDGIRFLFMCICDCGTEGEKDKCEV